MNYKNIVGIGLLAAGVVILLVTLGMGYGLYKTVINTGKVSVTQTPTNITLTNGTAPSMATIVGAVVSAMASQLPIARYTSEVLATVILALFASIGYKMARLGIQMLTANRGKDADK